MKRKAKKKLNKMTEENKVVENNPVEPILTKELKPLIPPKILLIFGCFAALFIAFILGSAFTSCPEQAPCEVCDYTSLTNQNIELVNKYSNCTIDKAALQTEYNNLKEQNNKLKIDYLNAQVNNTYNKVDTSVSCISFIQQIARLEERLDECYQMNETFNCTEAERDLDICEEKLENITDMLD